MPSSPVVVARNRVGTATSRGDTAAAAVARQDLAEAHIRAVIDRCAGALRPEQREALAATLLRGGAA